MSKKGETRIKNCKRSRDGLAKSGGMARSTYPSDLSDREWQLRRWLPNRSLVIVGDNGYAVLDLLHCCQSLREPVTLITRLRLDAGLYDPAPPRQPGQSGRPRVKGSRRPTLKELLHVPDLPWLTASVSWYDGTIRTLELASQTAVWFTMANLPYPSAGY